MLSSTSNSDNRIKLNSSLVVVKYDSKKNIGEEEHPTYHKNDKVESVPSIVIIGQ